MSSVFISYSRKDVDFARLLAADLDRLGADVWIDVDDIPAGMKWSTAIQRGLDSCEAMIVVISPDSMASPNVEDEWQSFLDDKKVLIPVLLRPARIHFQLRRIQYVDFHTHDYQTAFNRLYSELTQCGIQLAPLSTLELLEPAPKESERADLARLQPGGRGGLWIGLVLAALLVATVVIVVLLLSNGGGDGDQLDRTEVAQTVIAEQTAVVLALTASHTPEPSNTPTAQPTETPVPTAMETPIPTAISSPTAAPTLPSGGTLTPSSIPAGSPNRDWTPITQEFDGVPFVYVPAGCFMMGSEDGGDDEKPVHEVCLSAYWIGQTEVTNAQYKQCVDAGACSPPADRITYGDSAFADHPVVYIDWNQANAYAQWIGGSLPTEAQWEYAARGPEGWIYPWGNELDSTRLNFCDVNCAYSWRNDGINDSYAKTAPVGSYASGASWVGALDLAGNVWEWAADYYDETYYASIGDGVAVDPLGPALDTGSRVVRGGSWYGNQNVARAVYRYGINPFNRSHDFGIRVVRVPHQ